MPPRLLKTFAYKLAGPISDIFNRSFDSTMTMSRHINAVVKSGFYHLRNIAKVRNVLTLNTTKNLIHAFVISKIDNYNSLLYGLPKQLIDKLQHLLNAAARAITGARKNDHIRPILQELH